MRNILLSTTLKLWELSTAARAWAYRSSIFRQRKLTAPVVSIGNISFGGTGKTPTAIWLARKLAKRGYRTTILTRGYRRRTKGTRTLLAGADQQRLRTKSTSFDDGDETQLYLRHLPETHIGIAADRFDAGSMLERQVPVDVHLLDDGFQHLTLARNCDIVLIDASVSSRNGRALHHRLLREPISALGRAHVLMMTRCEQADDSSIYQMEKTLRQINPAALLLREHTVLSGYRNDLSAHAKSISEMAGKRALGLCALGNPDNFFRMLRTAEVNLVATRTYADHHHYNDQDVDQINDLLRSHSAECLITTEKDVVNLPHPERFADNFIAPAYWADIDVAISGEDELLELLEQKIGFPPELSGRN